MRKSKDCLSVALLQYPNDVLSPSSLSDSGSVTGSEFWKAKREREKYICPLVHHSWFI